MTGDELRALREARKLKRPQVAEAVGIPAGRISRIETGTSARPDEVERLRAFYENGQAAASPVMTASAEDAATDSKPSATAVIKPNKKAQRKRTLGPLPELAHLRFTDGAVVDPGLCPRMINSRSHWSWDAVTQTATCKCTADDLVQDEDEDDETEDEDESALQG